MWFARSSRKVRLSTERRLTDTAVREALAAFSSSNPTPGGGSAAALASAFGTSLLIMVSGLAKTRAGAESERAALASATPTLTDLRDRLTQAVDADTAAYDQVVAAYQLPKGSPDEQQARKDAIQRALREATEVPLAVVRLSASAMAGAETVAINGHTGAASDVGVAIALLRAGLHGARLNVEINLGSMRDETYAAATRGVLERLASQADRSADAAERALARR
jgi:formiminotetrahydrofolate cyclodeaminase